MRELGYEDRLARLPVWAQEYLKNLQISIRSLQTRIKHLEEERSIQISSADEPRITWENSNHGEHGIPEYSNIRFHINRPYGTYIAGRWDDRDGVVVTSTESLIVHPIATNRIHLSTQER